MAGVRAGTAAGRSPGEAVSAHGLLLEISRRFPMLQQVYDPKSLAYLRILAAHRRRVRKELKRFEDGLPVIPYQRSWKGENPPRVIRRAGGGDLMRWEQLRVLDCSKCAAELLGPSHEWVRKRAVPQHAAFLPQPVAGVVADRPVCSACFKEGKDVSPAKG